MAFLREIFGRHIAIFQSVADGVFPPEMLHFARFKLHLSAPPTGISGAETGVAVPREI